MQKQRLIDIGLSHHGFLVSRNYNSSTDLEALGLVSSETSEAIIALIENEGEERFHEEISDIGLRAIGIIFRYKAILVNPMWIEDAVARVRSNESWMSYITPKDAVTHTLFPIAKAMNEARKMKVTQHYCECLCDILAMVLIVASDLGVDVYRHMEMKIAKNLEKPPSDRIK
ncbi:hypothetical protein [Bdellovibrio sp. BCCA]|uniref:hypothetical protein n=1 Tax=Bdellovibrio sp. BCCA TaxID=3136281 RepID=UPI0030F25B3E